VRLEEDLIERSAGAHEDSFALWEMEDEVCHGGLEKLYFSQVVRITLPLQGHGPAEEANRVNQVSKGREVVVADEDGIVVLLK
jgi:hypothetical protein